MTFFPNVYSYLISIACPHFQLAHFLDSPSSLLLASDLDRSIVTATPAEMRNALSQSYITGDSCLMGVAEACFIDDSMESDAKQEVRIKVDQYKILLLPIIESHPNLHHCAEQLKKLASNASKRFDHRIDDSNINVILQSGKRYLSGGHAEKDVLLVSPFFRGMLYQVGSAEAPNEEMLLQGSTFVPTKTMTNIVEEFEHLILFVLRTKPALLHDQLHQATQIRDFVFEEFSGRMNEGELEFETTKRIIGTNILFGMMISIFTENPTGLESNTLQQYLIGRGLKSVSSRSYLGFRAANEISKNSNNLLRLVRHMVCGHICRTARQISSNPSFNQDKFMRDTVKLLKVIQNCDSTSSSCKHIRMGKEIDRKNPTKVAKGFDPKTGEVMVGQIYIAKPIWSKAIPTTAEKFKLHLYPLFTCPHLLDKFLNVENKLVMTGTNCNEIYVLVKGESILQTILILPIFFRTHLLSTHSCHRRY